MRKALTDKEAVKRFEAIISRVNKDPKIRQLAEENQRRYGTLTAEDLKKRFTI